MQELIAHTSEVTPSWKFPSDSLTTSVTRDAPTRHHIYNASILNRLGKKDQNGTENAEAITVTTSVQQRSDLKSVKIRINLSINGTLIPICGTRKLSN